MKRLARVLAEKREELGGLDGSGFRAMVFVQQRVTCRVLFEYLNSLPDLANRCGFVTGEGSVAGRNVEVGNDFNPCVSAVSSDHDLDRISITLLQAKPSRTASLVTPLAATGRPWSSSHAGSWRCVQPPPPRPLTHNHQLGKVEELGLCPKAFRLATL